MTVHSPLGASGAERWLNCPGSIGLLKFIGGLTESDEPDYRKEGTAAHAAAAWCLATEADGWEAIGMTFEGVVVDAVIARAIQVYLDRVRQDRAEHPDADFFIEYGISSPIHPLFFGTLDNAIVVRENFDNGGVAIINDYKHGEGLAVDVAWNPQLMYYAWGVIETRPWISTVVLRIIQPRGYHDDGPVREWVVDADVIRNWVNETLVPAMQRTELDETLDAGPWCRFCPAKLVCPLLTGLYGAAAKADPKSIPNLSDERLGQEYQHIQAVKFYIKALQDENFNRLSAGRDVPGTKLVRQKVNRVWKPGAEVLFKERFGDKAYSPPQFLSPPQAELIGADAKLLVHEWAYSPTDKAGLTVALASDKKPAVIVKSLGETFADALANLDPGAAE